MPKISIIVPIYNVEQYLCRCIDSILNQTFNDFECILVDDGSPDRCGDICDEYAKKDKRIRVIHKPNGGLSDARNTGIDAAKGEYLGFVDSDDWIHPQMYEILYKGIVENNVKLSVCAYEETEAEKEFEQIPEPRIEIHNGMEFLVSYNATAVVAWNKLYHRSLFEDIRYPVGKLHEDEFVTYKILYKAGSVAFVDNEMYIYFSNDKGISKSEFSLKRLDALDALEERYGFFENLRVKKYKKWAIRNLLMFYWFSYQSTLQKQDVEYKNANRVIVKKMRRLLITKRIYADVSIKKYPHYYEVAFPRFMKIYWLYVVIKNKIQNEGFADTLKKSFHIYLNSDYDERS